ncbi:hypothetical protein LJR296_007253 [Cupriavidus necator]|uniref:hypothetical protein n=1 Tax=Cupriavidus necator TaxID=106590 RepID=UPI003ECE2344
MNAWITVVIRVGSLCALASAAWLYKAVPIVVLHACYAGACAVMLGVSYRIYRKEHAAES